MKHPDDMSLNELEQFDDGLYYNEERGSYGMREFGYQILATAIAFAGFYFQSWWIAAPSIVLVFYAGITCGLRKLECKENRLRAVAYEEYEYELARKAEEEMV